MGLQQSIKAEPVSRLPLREALLVGPETSPRMAVTTMKAKQLGCVVVVDGGGKPLGTFTESSLVNLLASDPGVLDHRTVADFLDPKWAVVRQTAPVLEVLKAMHEQDVRFVVVTDGEGRAVALTGQKGMMEYIAEHYPQQVMVQRVGSKPTSEREGA
ncbi:MAG: CBS domain-containing protein [Planctomycetota bacterium]